MYKGIQQQIYDLLNYNVWTVFLHSDHIDVSALLDLITAKKQVCVVNSFLPLNKDDFLLIRPDQIVAVFVDMSLDGDKFNFQVEFLTVEDAEKYAREDKFQNMASDIIADILNVKKNEAPSIITDI